MFYTFRQNNSGGSFDFDADKGISVNVIVEADSVEEANNKAEAIGLYFDGCSSGQDCECCGDRWSSCWKEDGDPVPSLYGTPVGEFVASIKWMGEQPETFVHYADGSVKGL